MKKHYYWAILRRIVSSIIVLLLLVTFIFVLVRLAPGNPEQKFISPQLSPQLVENITRSFGLDQPILFQYYSFVVNIFSGNFGVSYNYRQPVFLVIKDYFLFTLFFASISFLIQLLLGYIIAKYSFSKEGKLFDRLSSKFSIVLFSTPTFVVGLILVYFFSVKLDVLPTSGIKATYHENFSTLEKLLDYFAHLILPVITLSLAGIALFYKYLRDNFNSVKNSSFILNLRANGMNKEEIFRKHIFPNAVQPLISIAGIEFGILLGGALLTEVIFSLPGMGRLTVTAILNRDFPVVVACSFVAGLMMILSNLAADLIKIKLDKRFLKELVK
jgi:peptide/nickel transport system permease protein